MSGPIQSASDIDVSQSRASHRIKFGLIMTDRKHIPKWVGYLAFVLCHLQSLAMIFKTADLCLDNNGSAGSALSQSYYTLFIPSEWFSYNDTTSINVLLYMIMAYFFILFWMMMVIHGRLRCRKEIPRNIQIIFGLICYIQPLFLFFPIQNFLTSALNAILAGTFTEGVSTATVVILIFDIAVNSSLTGTSTRVFQVMLKTRDPLSAKNHKAQSHEIGTRFVTLILWQFVDGNDTVKTVLLILTFLNMVMRDVAFFYMLPYYHVQTLQIGAAMQALTTTLAGLSLFFRILEQLGADIPPSTLEISWLFLSIMLAIIYVSFLWKLLTRLFISDVKGVNLYHIVHKRSLFRYLMKERIDPHQDQHKIDLVYYWLRSKAIFITKKFHISFEEFLDDKKYMQEMVKFVMLKIIKAYPKSELAKVNLAYFYVKHENSFLLANNLVEEVLHNSPSFPALLSMSIVRLELQRKLFIQYSHQEENASKTDGLNMLKYVQVHDRADHLKKNMNDQIKLQLNFWNNFLAHEPEMGVLADISTEVNLKRQKVQKSWQKFLKVRDPTFTRPLLAYGLYSSFVNNDTVVGEKCLEQYHKDVKRYSHLTDKDELTDDTLFSDKTIQVSMSGSKTKLGRILDCSQSIDYLYGWQRDFLVDRPVTMIMPQFYRDKHDGFLLTHYNTGKTKLLNRTVTVPVTTNDNYIVPSYMHIKMNPLVEAGVSYISTIRPTSNGKLMVLVRRDGSIDSMSREFAEDMNIHRRKKEETYKMIDFCPDFKQVNVAFNIMAYNTIIENSGEASPTKRTTQLGDLNMSFGAGGDTTTHRGKRLSISDLNTALAQNISTHSQMRQGRTPKKHSSAYQQLEIDGEVRSVFAEFSAGSRLYFYPQKSYPVEGNKINLFREADEGEPVIYKVQVMNWIFDKEFIKCVMLERIFKEDMEAEEKERIIAKKTSILNSFEIDADEKGVPTVPTDRALRNQTSISPAIRTKTRETSLLTPTTHNRLSNWVREDGTGNLNESAMDLSVLDEIHSQDTPRIKILERNVKARRDESTPHNLHNTTSYSNLVERTRMPLLNTVDGESPRLITFQNSLVKKVESVTSRSHYNKHKKSAEIISADTSDPKNINSMEAQHRDPQQEDNLLKAKLKRLTDKINQGFVDATRENSIGSSYLSRGRKVQTLVAQALKMENKKRSAMMFTGFFFAFLIVSLGLQSLQLVNVYEAILDIKQKTTVIEEGLLRIDALITLDGNIRIWKGVLQGYIILSTLDITSEYIVDSMVTPSMTALNQYNNLLREQVSNIDSEFQSYFYQKDVRMYQRLDSTKTYYMTESNFDAIEDIVNRALTVVHTVPSNLTYGNNVDLTDVNFILDNSLDDLLSSSENSVSILVTDLSKTMTSVKNRMIAIYSIFTAGAVLFLIACLHYLKIMRTSAQRFMNIFFRLDPAEARKTASFLKHFNSTLGTNILDLEVPDDNVFQEEGKIMVKSTKDFRKASLNKQYNKQLKLFGRLCPFYTMFFGWGIGYFILALGLINTISSKQLQIRSSLEMQNSQNLLMREAIELILANATTTIRNEPIVDDFLANLNTSQQIVEFINQFRKSDHSLEASQQEIFYSFPCDYFLSYSDANATYNACLSIADGTTSVGLAALNSQLYLECSQLYQSYMALTNKSVLNLLILFYSSLGDLRNLILVTRAMLEELYEATAEIFEENVTTIETEAIVFTVITITVGTIGFILVWLAVIRKIIAYEAKDREILQIVPIKVILANRYLRAHVLNDAGTMLDSIKKFL